MYEFIPSRKSKTEINISFIAFIGALVIMFISAVPGLPLRWISQLASICLFSLSLAIMGRFILKGYVYNIAKNDNEKLDLTVTEIKKRSRITVCRIGLEGIEKAVKITASEKKDISSEWRGRKVFNYCVDISPSEYICVFAEECGERLVIKLAYDDTLFGILSGQDRSAQ